tara:strand:+ start:539 stop:859 length:321 start_codon:yes stop_codon:yes gene_type:complete
MRFSTSKTIEIELSTMKRVLSGKDKEGMKRLISIVNTQEFTPDDTEYFNKPFKIDKQYDVLGDDDKPVGEPLCFDINLDMKFAKWLDEPLGLDYNIDLSMIKDPFK